METLTKIDGETLKVETTTERLISKEELLREKSMYEEEIKHLQDRVKEIDLKLDKLK